MKKNSERFWVILTVFHIFLPHASWAEKKERKNKDPMVWMRLKFVNITSQTGVKSATLLSLDWWCCTRMLQVHLQRTSATNRSQGKLIPHRLIKKKTQKTLNHRCWKWRRRMFYIRTLWSPCQLSRSLPTSNTPKMK